MSDVFTITVDSVLIMREAVFSRSKNQVPTYLASNYGRSPGLSVSKGAFSYSNIKYPHQAPTIAKEIRYLRNQYNYGNNSKQDHPYARTMDQQKRENQRMINNRKQQQSKTQTIRQNMTPNRIEEKQQSTAITSFTKTQDIQRPQHGYKGLGLVGLNNIGNTCFMNAVLQCLLNLPGFNDYFLENRHNEEAQSSCRVASSYARLVQAIRSTSKRSETPAQLKNAVAAKKPQFSGYAQQDSQQFLASFLELLSSQLNRSRKPKYKQLTADLSKQKLEQISQDWWNYNKQRQNSVVCDYFTGQLLSRVTCCSCNHQSIAFDNSWDFALNFSQNDGGDIHKMVENFLSEEVISSDYYCSRCKAFRTCKRKLDFYRLPRILVLQIKRFSFGKYSKQKINKAVRVSENLDLRSMINFSRHSSTNRPSYNLVGIVNHSGDINFGHYTAQCRNPVNLKWYNFNDSSVSEGNMSSRFQSSSPYLLFYAKSQ